MSWKNVLFQITPGALFYQAVTCQRLWQAQISRMLDAVHAESPKRVLDLGCGAGASCFEVARVVGPGVAVTGVDVSPVMLRAARRALASKFSDVQAQVNFVQADARSLPFADGSFDLVTGHSFLYLVDEPEAVLREVWRVLSPGGRLLLMEPAEEVGLAQALGRTAPELARLWSTPWAALRFVFAIVHWRMLAAVVGTLSQTVARGWLERAAYSDLVFEPTLAGLGWHMAARRA